MSTLILSPKSIEKLCNNSLIINDMTYNKYQCQTDIIFKKAYDLNIKSYNFCYPTHKITKEQQEEKFNSINLKSKEKFNNPCEILKALEKLRYNIENEVIQSQMEIMTVKAIDDIINQVKTYIIEGLSDYKNIDWGNI